MIGFIKKDLAIIKGNFKIMGLLIIIYALLSLFGDMDISFIIPFMSVMIMISTFSYDNFNKWDAYSISLPNGRKNSVKAKYIATILMILVFSLLTIILSFIISYVNSKNINYVEILIYMLGTIFGTLLVLTITYPIIYKWGVEKARIVMFIVVLVLAILGSLAFQFIDFTNLAKLITIIEDYLIIIIIAMALAMVYISYKISQRIFMKKEF